MSYFNQYWCEIDGGEVGVGLVVISNKFVTQDHVFMELHHLMTFVLLEDVVT